MVRRLAVLAAAVLLVAMLTAARADAARPRFSVAPDKVRVVLDLPDATTFTDQSTPTQLQITFAAPLDGTPQPIPVDDPIVKEIAVSAAGEGQSLLTVTLLKPRNTRIFTLSKPFRLVVDILKDFTVEERRVLSPAVTYIRQEKQAGDRYLALHILEVNTRDPKVHFRMVTAEGERERVASMVARTGALCGINGGYYWQTTLPPEPADYLAQTVTIPNGQGNLPEGNGPPAPAPPPRKIWTRPVGLLKIDGEIRAMPIWGRTSVAFPPTGSPLIGNPTGCWLARFADGSELRIPDWLDASRLSPRPSVLVISGRLTHVAEANPNGVTVLIRDGKVALRTTTALPLAKEELALSLTGECAVTLDAVLQPGAAVTLIPQIDGEWERYLHAVGGGPRLLRNGSVETTGLAERFQPDVLYGRRARTGLGVTRDGRVIVVISELPGPYGGGVTLEELAEILKSRGAVEALNLDGGGSSCLAIGNTTVNYPPQTWVRPLPVGICIFDDRVPCTPKTTTEKELN
ncbi:MAG: phosphodiester glycosidase family protein [Armatimonadota bacterium]